jgi:hypothetical protein
MYSGLKARQLPPGKHVVEELAVQVDTLDSSLPDGYAPSLIKIDVEGAERQVIEGGIETISRYRPAILFEHESVAARAYGTRPGHIFELLCSEAGLSIFDLDGGGPYLLDEFEREVEAGRRWNYVAHA